MKYLHTSYSTVSFRDYYYYSTSCGENRNRKSFRQRQQMLPKRQQWTRKVRSRFIYIDNIWQSTDKFIQIKCHFERPWVILSDLAKYSMTQSVARSLCDSWATCSTGEASADETRIEVPYAPKRYGYGNRPCNEMTGSPCVCIFVRPGYLGDRDPIGVKFTRYDTIRYDSVYLTCSKTLTGRW